jgi:hypothetical protein
LNNDKQIILDRLNSFIEKDKFSFSAWEERGLNPSNIELSDRLQRVFNECAMSLTIEVNSDLKPSKLKSILKKTLDSLNSSDFDTEEREFICDYFLQLSEIISIDFKDNLNNWLYGKVLSTLFKFTSFIKGRGKIDDKFSQACTQCGSILETFILRREKGIPDHCWTIIQCNNCNEFNLLSVGPNIKEFRFGEYKSIEQLLKSEYTEEQARARLEQIKHFRRK